MESLVSHIQQIKKGVWARGPVPQKQLDLVKAIEKHFNNIDAVKVKYKPTHGEKFGTMYRYIQCWQYFNVVCDYTAFRKELEQKIGRLVDVYNNKDLNCIEIELYS